MQETKLALAHLDAIAAPRVLIVGLRGAQAAEALRERGCDVVEFHNDVRGSPSAVVGAWLPPSEPFDTALVALPREAGRLRMWLAMAGASARAGGTVYLAGHNDAGARSAGKRLAEVFGEAFAVDARYHCRLYRSTVSTAPPASLEDWRATHAAAGLEVVSYPGVFSHGRLDEGTAMLLGTLDGLEPARALDVGCGSGIIATTLALRGSTVEAVDSDALAVRATTETLELNGAQARVALSDLYDAATGAFDLIVSNPPFHAERKTLTSVAERIIREGAARLERNGELRIVANRFLPYRAVMERSFKDVSILTEDRRYRVFRARIPA